MSVQHDRIVIIEVLLVAAMFGLMAWISIYEPILLDQADCEARGMGAECWRTQR